MVLRLHITDGWVQFDGPVLNRYTLAATDTADQREVWTGTVSWWANRFVERSDIGSNLATKIVGQLASDGILKSCTD